MLTKDPSRSRSGRRSGASVSRWMSALFAGIFFLGSIFVVTAEAQKAEKTAAPRKLVSQVEANYPPDLKRALIGGVVRLNIVVTPRGTVDDIQISGGNPILADAAIKAVKQWKYTPATASTNIRVNITFDPTR